MEGPARTRLATLCRPRRAETRLEPSPTASTSFRNRRSEVRILFGVPQLVAPVDSIDSGNAGKPESRPPDCGANGIAALDVVISPRLSRRLTLIAPRSKSELTSRAAARTMGSSARQATAVGYDLQMIARIETSLPTSAERAWQALIKRDTFLYITRGLLGFAGADKWPDQFRQGDTIETRLLFFHLLPAWRHTLYVVGLDEAKGELTSREAGGPIRQWNHRITIERAAGDRCRYTDEIDIKAGLLTPLVWVYAHGFYRYRQRRWRRLASGL